MIFQEKAASAAFFISIRCRKTRQQRPGLEKSIPWEDLTLKQPNTILGMIICLATASAPTLACENNDFFPENDLQFPVGIKTTGLSEVQYNNVLDKVFAVYGSLVKAQGGNLILNRKWTNSSVNAGTYRDGQNWYINVYGGYARHPYATEDALTLVLCHEIGHHLGGAPKKQIKEDSWSSTEGQSDYFATLKCLRRVFRKDDNLTIVNNLRVPKYVRAKCELSFPKIEHAAICMRTSMAGQSVANVDAETSKLPLTFFSTPDQNQVEMTYERHPVPQCRLDTYFQGSLCDVSPFVSVSQAFEMKGTCHPKLGFSIGNRPNCWYREK